MSLVSHCGLPDNGLHDLAKDEVSTGVSYLLILHKLIEEQ